MSSSTADVLKLGPVLDLAAAEGLLATMRERMQSSPGGTNIDASDVETMTLACIQVLLSASKSGHKIAVLDPSEAFTSAFADLALVCPQDDVEVAFAEAPTAPAPAAAPAIADAPPVQPEAAAPAPQAPVQSENAAMAKRILTIDDSKT